MRRLKQEFTLLVLTAVWIGNASGAQTPTAEEVLKSVENYWAKIESFEADMVTEIPELKIKQTSHIIYKKPDKMRIISKDVGIVTVVNRKRISILRSGKTIQFPGSESASIALADGMGFSFDASKILESYSVNSLRNVSDSEQNIYEIGLFARNWAGGFSKIIFVIRYPDGLLLNTTTQKDEQMLSAHTYSYQSIFGINFPKVISTVNKNINGLKITTKTNLTEVYINKEISEEVFIVK